nr:MAG TPA: hypothetical protein [Caudoviricetes sp.]
MIISFNSSPSYPAEVSASVTSLTQILYYAKLDT